MTSVVPKSKNRKVNGYVKAALKLEAVRREREDRYDRYVRPLDRKRELRIAEVGMRFRALTGGQRAQAEGILAAVRIGRALPRADGGQPPGS